MYNTAKEDAAYMRWMQTEYDEDKCLCDECLYGDPDAWYDALREEQK